MNKEWIIKKPDMNSAREISNMLNISYPVACVLVNRGIENISKAKLFFQPNFLDLSPPSLLPDMEPAVKRLRKAVDNHEKILIYGDSDIDGISGVCIMYYTLKSLGVIPCWYIPHEEGYGLNQNIIKQYMEKEISLIITVDCGISNIEEVLFAKKNGVDIIITDHHQPLKELPPAVAVVNPKRKDSLYPFSELAGCTVSLKLAQGLMLSYFKATDNRHIKFFVLQLLDLVALGTIGDMMPLVGENRTLVKHGLQTLTKSRKLGIRMLIDKFTRNNNSITAKKVAFNLVPAVNACARLVQADLVMELFLSEEDYKIEKILNQIAHLNKNRKELQDINKQKFIQLLNQQCDIEHDKIFFVVAEGIEQGVTGIVANQLVRKYHRPVLLLIIDGSRAIGSGRSVDGFGVYNMIEKCSDFLVKYGGHPQAVGFTVDVSCIDGFKRRIKEIANQEISPELLKPKLEIDAELSLSDINEKLIDELQKLEPFGKENSYPVFLLRNMLVSKHSRIGATREHIKMEICHDGNHFDTVGWKLADLAENILKNNAQVDLAVKPEFNQWKRKKSIQLVIEDMKGS